MADPKDFDEYTKLSHANQVIGGSGLDTFMEIPCPFCASAGFMRWNILEMERTASQSKTCKNCERSAKLIFSRAGGGVSFEIVQTGGPDQPEWLQPKMRRV